MGPDRFRKNEHAAIGDRLASYRNEVALDREKLCLITDNSPDHIGLVRALLRHINTAIDFQGIKERSVRLSEISAAVE